MSEAYFKFGTIDVIDQDIVDIDKLTHGKVSAMCGEAAYQAIAKVIDLAHER